MTTHGDIRDVLLALPHHPWANHDSGSHYVSSNIFPMKYLCLREEAPNARSLFEFGALVGYFLVTAIHACPSLNLIGWADDESHCPGSNELCLENVRVASEGRQMWVRPSLKAPMAHDHYDVVHVDGDHSYGWAVKDLSRALQMEPQLVLVDDTIAHDEVLEAVEDVCREHGLKPNYHITVNGFATIRVRPMPERL